MLNRLGAHPVARRGDQLDRGAVLQLQVELRSLEIEPQARKEIDKRFGLASRLIDELLLEQPASVFETPCFLELLGILFGQTPRRAE